MELRISRSAIDEATVMKAVMSTAIQTLRRSRRLLRHIPRIRWSQVSLFVLGSGIRRVLDGDVGFTLDRNCDSLLECSQRVVPNRYDMIPRREVRNTKRTSLIGHAEERVMERQDGGRHEVMYIAFDLIDPRFLEWLSHRSACWYECNIHECPGFQCEVRVVHDGIVVPEHELLPNSTND